MTARAMDRWRHVNNLSNILSKCFENNNDINLSLLQVRSTPIGAGLSNSTTLLFNSPIKAQLLQIKREPINFNADDEKYMALKLQQDRYVMDNDTCRYSVSFPIGSRAAMQREDGGPWIHGVMVEGNSVECNG